MSAALDVKRKVHVARGRRGDGAADYYHAHRDSPIALACSNVGAVKLAGLAGEISHAVSTSDLRCAYGIATSQAVIA